MNKLIYIISVCLVMSSCGYDRFGDYARADTPPPLANTPIELLRANYTGQAVDIRNDIVIQGWVTSSDKTNNFYQTFVIQDNTGAVEIKAGIYDLHNIYPLGMRVVISTRGLSLGADNGVLQLGAKALSSSAYQVENIDARALLDDYITRDDSFAEPAPKIMAIASLAESKCGLLVKINSLQFAPAISGQNATWGVLADYNGNPATGYIKFKDPAGDSIYVASSGYADFADAAVPSGRVSITGILQYGKIASGAKRYMLKIRDLTDVE